MQKRYILFFLCLHYALLQELPAQLHPSMNNEDSLARGLNQQQTLISGYGSVFYQYNQNAETAQASLERVVFFIGHSFNAKISLFTELEMENAKVEGKEEGGEIAFEQALLKFNLTPQYYMTAGLLLPRIGHTNINHLPTQYNSVERPMVEQLLIPSTWRELGVSFYGRSYRIPLNYSVALLNGLNSANFKHGDGIRSGRAEGKEASAKNLALTASVEYVLNHFSFQLDGYVGGTLGLSKRNADSLGLNSGALGTTLYLGSANIRYAYHGFNAQFLYAHIHFPEANKVNIAYANNLANNMYGTYLELAYDLLYGSKKALKLFTRYELMDLNASVPNASPSNYDGTLRQQHVLLGINYLPIPNIIIKADIRLLHTGDENPAITSLSAIQYQPHNAFFNLGIGYSF